MKLTNKNLQYINIGLTIIVVIIALLTFVLTKQQINYTEKAGRADRIQQVLSYKEYSRFVKKILTRNIQDYSLLTEVPKILHAQNLTV